MSIHYPRLGQKSQRLLDQITLKHGPRELLGHFFLAADRAARDRGVTLTLSTDFDLLREVNARNQGSWHGLAPMFDSRFGGIDASNGYWMMGHDSEGNVVCTQAAHFYDLGQENLRSYIESLHLFYPDPEHQKCPNESCTVTSPSAEKITGRLVFSGSTWIHPDYRKRALPKILPRISRALALTKWDTETTISIVTLKLVEKGVAAAYGYRNIEPGVLWLNALVGPRCEATLVWMPRQDLLADLARFDDLVAEADKEPATDKAAPARELRN
jgi:hypothetical protein